MKCLKLRKQTNPDVDLYLIQVLPKEIWKIHISPTFSVFILTTD